jgi:replicative DNA helicase
MRKHSTQAAIEELDEYHRRRHAGEIVSIPTGIPLIDKNLNIEEGEVVVIAARPAGGKTAVMGSLFCSMVEKNIATPAFLTMELSKRVMTMRLVSCMSGVPFSFVQEDVLDSLQQRKVSDAKFTLATSKAEIVDEKISLDRLHNLYGELRGNGINCVFIDQLSKIRHDRAGSRFEKFSNTMNEITSIANEWHMTTFLAAQVRRPEDNQTRPPTLRELKESGCIEEDADIVLMPWRPNSEGRGITEVDWYGRSVPTEGRMFLFCRKYRSGQPWAEMLMFDEPTMTLNRARS